MPFTPAHGLPPRGKTYYAPKTPPANADWTQDSIIKEGTKFVFKDQDPTAAATGALAIRTNKDVVCQLVRNDSGIALLPKRLVTWQSGYWGRRVDGYARLDNAANVAGVVDEHLPAAGAPDNDLFWITISGPCLVKTPLGADATNVFSEGTPLLALTAATSQCTTAGRVQPWADTSSLTGAQQMILGLIGVALSAKTTANTNADMLCDIQLLKA